MQVHSLRLDDFIDDRYILIGIHAALEDYKLAFLLNQALQVQFKRCKKDINYLQGNINASFSVFEYEEQQHEQKWYLIANSYKSTIKNRISFNSLFQENEVSTFLVPEKKKIDYFLKLEGGINTNFVTKLVEKINQINQIVTSYSIDVKEIKSKESLIIY